MPATFRTYTAKRGEIVPRWHLVDASGAILGRLASRIAVLLQGKHKPQYTPHVDTGDFVVVLNAAKIRVTGKKRETAVYRYWSGYLGGLKERKLGELLEHHPEVVMRLAVRRMLPKGRLGKAMLSKLNIYPGAEHPHAAQKPESLKL